METVTASSAFEMHNVCVLKIDALAALWNDHLGLRMLLSKEVREGEGRGLFAVHDRNLL